MTAGTGDGSGVGRDVFSAFSIVPPIFVNVCDAVFFVDDSETCKPQDSDPVVIDSVTCSQ